MAQRNWTVTVLLAVLLIGCCLPSVTAFGAGNIPGHSFLEGKAYRHGDIEDILSELVKKSGGFLGRGTKFSGLDIKRIYFGNWLRDYSQAMDIAGLSKLPKQTILNLVMALAFLAMGYGTGEFEVTEERLGVYLPTEHIDSPKGYAADQPGGDARKFDPRLRPPVDPRELEIDPRTGMKNYIANEHGNWDTSARLVRERIHQCIDAGRRGRNGNDKDVYDSFRLLGCLLHTLEDFSAHSNFVELSLRRLGHQQVFCHVGDACHVQSPAGPCPPLVTGTFGGADFIHSLLGEATDHISEASVSDLSKAMDSARSTDRGATDSLRDLLFQLPGDTGNNLSRDLSDIEATSSRAAMGDPSTMSPQELHATLWKVLTFRDNVVKGIEVGISKIPGLSSIVEKITLSLNRFVFTTLEPLLKPIMGQATQTLSAGSHEVLQSDAQFEVFNNPHSSDPTHSFLSKDHFNLILNEPAGRIAQIIVEHTVKSIVKAWEDTSINPDAVASEALEAFHHPYFINPNSKIQCEMGAHVKQWFESQSGEDKRYILNALTKDSVRNGKNKRKGHVSDQVGHGAGGHYNSFLSPEKVQAAATQHIPGAAGVFNVAHQVSGAYNTASNYVSRDEQGGYDATGGGAGGGFAPPPQQQPYNPPYQQQQSYAQSSYQQPATGYAQVQDPSFGGGGGGGGYPGAGSHHHQQPHGGYPGGVGGGYDQGPGPGGFIGGGGPQGPGGYEQGPGGYGGGYDGGAPGGFVQPPPHGGAYGHGPGPHYDQPPPPGPPQWGGHQQGGYQGGNGNGGYQQGGGNYY